MACDSRRVKRQETRPEALVTASEELQASGLHGLDRCLHDVLDGVLTQVE